MTPGPYYVDEKLERSDIRSDPTDGTVKQGALLLLTLNVSRIAKDGCAPLEGAIVDVWHCDAEGVYSDAVDPKYFDTTGKKFLRGYQRTDGNGVAKFTTIYPGWYPQRTPHIHYKIRSPASAEARLRVRLPGLLRRRPQRPGLRPAALCRQGEAHRLQPDRPDLQGERRPPVDAEGGAGRGWDTAPASTWRLDLG